MYSRPVGCTTVDCPAIRFRRRHLQFGFPVLQSAVNVKDSPITPVPPCWIPGFWIDPSIRLTNGAPGLLGSRFGTIHGLTQRGFTGTIPFGAMVPELEGLNTSAVAVALTLFVARLQMREKNVGRHCRITLTCTCGLIAKRPVVEVQSVVAPL
jgi:hypothetical protein